ncbi:hypothetical protein GCM10010383_69010 [Streptomyces lomondensis]|uniref:Uncharacterized protein n=1 Tax=Streptomyces lomondensis TaxID=68229 RepID=A0ABQ2XQX5_9ACTN|nr:hypothetical protein GCM10010383_69010 [Streptomyces lomondensis]
MDRPVAAADPVIWRTSRFCTVSCIHVPALETKFATDHQRMLRYLSDRQGECEAGWASWAGEGEEDTVRYSQDESEDSAGGGEENERHRLRCAVALLAGIRRRPS